MGPLMLHVLLHVLGKELHVLGKETSASTTSKMVFSVFHFPRGCLL